jgi:Zn-dependent peptidase ImmA (M78 family)/DNA-binding XRE family transcriptional regulator
MKKELGKRIKEERTKVRLTQEDLANSVGWKNYQTVVQIEAGDREVKAWELVKIARAFNIEMHTLLSSEQASETRPYVLWREKPASSAEKFEQNFLRRCEDHQFLEQLLDRRTVLREALPKFELNIEQCDWDWANLIADKTRIAMSLGSYPASTLIKTLEERFGVKFFSEDLGENGSAATSYSKFGACILLNGSEVAWRQNFSVAHELFHLITWNEPIFKKIEADESISHRNEKLADAFAAALLMPEDTIRECITEISKDNKLKYAGVVALARQFEVSTSALLWRLVYLKYLSRKDVDSILSDNDFKVIDKSSYRHLPKAIPEVGFRFVRLAYIAYQYGKISRARLSKMLGVSLVNLDTFLSTFGLVSEVSDHEISLSHS